ncbi:hypothetical protein KKD62_03585 [Patescibacteria group bacterium]|nr:hypothetical protein [Patescibacteria group bacterium]MBU1931782.1 hypothetical protein [Patescibacteria group bacterium]
MNGFIIKTGKIVGVAQAGEWAQVHIFSSKEKEKQLKFGTLLTAFSLKVDQDTEIKAGKELIQRFHELYYANDQVKPLARLKQAFAAIAQEVESGDELVITAGVIIETQKRLVFYGARTGGGEIFLQREQQLVKLIETKQDSVSGWLQPGDLLVLATKQFFKLIPVEKLASILSIGSIAEAVESLAPLIQQEAVNSKSAAIVAGIDSEIAKTGQLTGQAVKPVGLKPRFQAAVQIIKNNFQFFKKARKDRRSPEIFIKKAQFGFKERQKKTSLTVAIIFTVLLSLSIVLGMKKQQQVDFQAKIGSVLSEVDYRLKEGRELLELNPLRAKVLFEESQTLLKEKQTEFEVDSSEYQELAGKLEEIEQILAEVSHSYQVDSQMWLDLNIVNDGFRGETWDNGASGLVVWDQKNQTLISVNISNKSSEILAGGSELAGLNLLAADEERAYLLNQDEIFSVFLARKTKHQIDKEFDWGQLMAAVGFSGNLYLLDVQKNQVWKHVPVNNSLNDPSAYLKDEVDLDQAIDLAIDGSVWLLYQDPKIRKFTRGRQDAFNLVGLNQPLSAPTKIYTDENLENLYILDPQTTRVVVVDKTGEFRAEYIWPGLAGGKAVFADEDQGIILVLAGEKIFSLKIK